MSDILEKQHYKPSECIQLSADADLIVEEKLLQHPAYWQEYVDNLNFNQGCFFTSIEGKERLVEFEAFPLMAKRMFSDEGKLYAEVFPGLPMQVQVESFQYDDFDRFVCLSKNKSFPIGLTDSAQNDFFNVTLNEGSLRGLFLSIRKLRKQGCVILTMMDQHKFDLSF